MSSDKSTDVLNRLLVLHSRTLPLYLLDAAPWTQAGDDHSISVLHDIAHDQQDTAERIVAILMDRNGTPARGDFPLMFTAFNDLSVDYLVREMIRRQKIEINSIEQCVRQLAGDAEAVALAERI